jgi:DNA polymerase-3 subunit epsilon
VKFAVVDIETTGLFHQGHSITEIAVVHVDDGKAKLVFQSLVQPERSIPAAISHLTGISDQTVASSPTFQVILPQLTETLSDRIFVAHHVNFDFAFLKANFQAHGKNLLNQRLCTLKYARKVIPGQPSYKLNAICAHFGIENSSAHRATGDALATAELLIQLMKADSGKHIDALLGKKGHSSLLPAHLSTEDVLKLPESSGVYYFYGTDSKPIYIGKAKNLRRRVLSHFTGAGASRRQQLFQREILKINFKTTASEYQAWLLEDAEIKAHWPRYNVAQKVKAQTYAVVVYSDRTGYQRLGVIRSRHCKDALAWFGSLHEAKTWLRAESQAHGWNPGRAGLFQTDPFVGCDEDEFTAFLKTTKESTIESYLLAEAQADGTHAYALVLDGRYRGFGKSDDLRTFDREKIHHAPDSSTAKAVVRRMLMDDKVLKYPIQNTHV